MADELILGIGSHAPGRSMGVVWHAVRNYEKMVVEIDAI